MKIFIYLILFLGFFSVIRMAIFIVGANLYIIKEHFNRKTSAKTTKKALPVFSVIIPAYNESYSVVESVKSVWASKYPKHKLEIIVVDDGSTDDTLALLKEFQAKRPKVNLKIVAQPNGGKAHALNNAVRNYATGDLIMCLDADSSLDVNALRESARYFDDEWVVAMAANVRIRPNSTTLNIIQQIEYLLGYQMKRALNYFNSEYVIGGVGSVVRKEIMEKVGYYDTDTITEDMDLTLKVIKLGNKKFRVGFSSKVIAYTQSVLSISDLIRQRYRWKYGRMQTFLKYKSLFFSTDSRYGKLLTWVYLPYILFCDFLCFLEPLMISYVVIRTLVYQDWMSLLVVCAVISVYLMINIFSEDDLSWKTKIRYSLFAPIAYFLFYVLTFVEYIALVKVLLNSREIYDSIFGENEQICAWEHVERAKV
jgi:poly-beta-1,6-N-acetyl-D-glucosamine synthase